jgi:WXG100 family type VII secretion target
MANESSYSGDATLHAESPAMQVAVAHMDSTSTQIRALIKAINGHVTDVLATWHGDASIAFNGAAGHWNEAAIKMDRVLQDMHDGVHSSRVSHDTQEDANAQALTRAGQVIYGI